MPRKTMAPRAKCLSLIMSGIPGVLEVTGNFPRRLAAFIAISEAVWTVPMLETSIFAGPAIPLVRPRRPGQQRASQ